MHRFVVLVCLALVSACAPVPRSRPAPEDGWEPAGHGAWIKVEDVSNPRSTERRTRVAYEEFRRVSFRKAAKRLGAWGGRRVHISKQVPPRLVTVAYRAIPWKEALDDLLRTNDCLGYSPWGRDVYVEPGYVDQDRYGLELD